MSPGEHPQPTAPRGDADVPPAGWAVTLLSQLDGVSYPARVHTWESSDEGLVVNARVQVEPVVAALLADHRLWVSLPTDTGGVKVFGGVARAAGPAHLDISGVVPIVREQRRRSPRGRASAPVTVLARSGPARELRTVDLSRGGVRVSLRAPGDLTLGEQVTVEVRLEGGVTVPAVGEVIRVDHQAGHAVVRFEDLSLEHGNHIERFVLLRLAPDRRGEAGGADAEVE